jgi:hypothetical protein
MSKLRIVLKVKEADNVGSVDICDKALAVINVWRQSSSCACVSTPRDALHKAGLNRIAESVFGHIQDQTLTNYKLQVKQLYRHVRLQGQKGKAAVFQVSKLCLALVEHVL